MARDSQRSKVYDWERQLPCWDKGNLTLQECETIVAKVCQSYSKSIPIVKDGRGTRNASGTAREINLPLWARNKVVVLHEVTHSIVESKKYGSAWHGPEFMRLYIDLLERFELGTKRELTSSARAAGLQIARGAACIKQESWTDILKKDTVWFFESKRANVMRKYGLTEEQYQKGLNKVLKEITKSP